MIYYLNISSIILNTPFVVIIRRVVYNVSRYCRTESIGSDGTAEEDMEVKGT